MNEKIFLFLNSFVGKITILDLLGVLLAENLPYIFILVVLYIYFILKKKNEAIFSFYSMLIALFINQIIGFFYFHNRPFMDGLGITLVHHVKENSFPSDHTAFMAALAVTLFMQENTKNWGKLLLVLAIIGGVARVYVGVHYPFDIIFAVFTGVVGTFVVMLFKNKLQKLNNIFLNIDKKIFRQKSENINY